MNVYCRICGTAGAACGDSHQSLPLLTASAFFEGARTAMTEPQELKEYHYWVGQVEHSAMLTQKMADRLGAVPIDEELESPDPFANNEANRASTHTPAEGVTGPDDGAVPKARTARNKRSGGS